jgi:hypothetical protein
MDARDYELIKEIIHDSLVGWQAQTIAREDVTNIHLKDISDHFARLNGSVARHEQQINENLPHSIAKCAQTETIKEIRDTVVVAKKVVQIAGAVLMFLATIFGGYEIFKPKQHIPTQVTTRYSDSSQIKDTIE